MFRSMNRILRWTKGYHRRLYLGSLCSFLATWAAAGPVVLAAWALGLVIESAQEGTALDARLPWLCLGGIILLIVLRFVCAYWKNRLQESIGTERAAQQRLELGDLLKRVSLGYFSKNNLGDILAALTTELSTLELQSMKMVDAVINGYLQVLVIVLCMAFFCPEAALVAVVGVLLSAFALRGIGRQSARTAPVGHRAQEALSGAAIEYIHGLSVVKSFGQEGVSSQRFFEACRANKDIRIKNEFGFVPWNCLHLFSLKAAAVGLVLTAGWQTMNGTLELPVLLMAAMFSFTIFGSVESINDAAHILSVTDSVLDRLEELEGTELPDQDGKDISLEHYDICFDHVSFGYGTREVIHDVSFQLPQNSATAIVGPSGSGKSTLCALLARFYDVDQGRITVGGYDIRKMTCDSLLRNIAMVFQNVYLFHDTIRNNIRFGRPDAAEEDVIAAAKAARCHDFIMALPQGYDTMVGEGGSNLSGGEKQRISIARCLLKDAPIIILDEATASVTNADTKQRVDKERQTCHAGVEEPKHWRDEDERKLDGLGNARHKAGETSGEQNALNLGLVLGQSAAIHRVAGSGQTKDHERMRALGKEARCHTHDVHIGIRLHKERVEDVERTRDLLAVDHRGAANGREADKLVQDVVQARGDKQTLEEAVDESTKRTSSLDEVTECVDEHAEDGPDKVHHDGDERNGHRNHDGHKPRTAEEAESCRQIILPQTADK